MVSDCQYKFHVVVVIRYIKCYYLIFLSISVHLNPSRVVYIKSNYLLSKTIYYLLLLLLYNCPPFVPLYLCSLTKYREGQPRFVQINGLRNHVRECRSTARMPAIVKVTEVLQTIHGSSTMKNHCLGFLKRDMVCSVLRIFIPLDSFSSLNNKKVVVLVFLYPFDCSQLQKL